MRFASLFAVVLLSACASSKYIANSGSSHPARPDDCDVQLLGSQPKGDFAEIGICNAKAPGGGAFFDYSDKALAELKRCACRAGGNAVLIVNQREVSFLGSQQGVRATGTVLWIEQGQNSP